MGCVGVIITGSVGGIVSLSGGLIIILLNQFRFSYFLYAVIFGSASFWAVANLVNYEGIAVVRRLLYKQNDLSGESRYYMWGELLEKKFRLLGYSHGELKDVWEYAFEYPHNIFLELILFYGVAGVIVCIGLVISLFTAWRNSAKHPEVSLIFYVLVSGSLLSGDLSDNYGVVALTMVFLGFLLTASRSNPVNDKYEDGAPRKWVAE